MTLKSEPILESVSVVSKYSFNLYFSEKTTKNTLTLCVEKSLFGLFHSEKAVFSKTGEKLNFSEEIAQTLPAKLKNFYLNPAKKLLTLNMSNPHRDFHIFANGFSGKVEIKEGHKIPRSSHNENFFSFEGSTGDWSSLSDCSLITEVSDFNKELKWAEFVLKKNILGILIEKSVLAKTKVIEKRKIDLKNLKPASYWNEIASTVQIMMSENGNKKIGKNHLNINSTSNKENPKIPCKPSDRLSDIVDSLYKKSKKVKNTEKETKEQIKLGRRQIQEMKVFFDDFKNIKTNAEFVKFTNKLPDEIRLKGRRFPEWKILFENTAEIKKKSTIPIKIKGVRTIKDEKGNIFYLGTSSSGNDEIYRNLSKPNDVWFHVQGDKGSHVLFKNKKKDTPSSDVIQKGAILAFHHSKLKKTGKGEVDYTFRKFVKKPKNSPSGLVTCSRLKSVSVNLDSERHSNLLKSLLKSN